jgi:hypothetical protein
MDPFSIKTHSHVDVDGMLHLSVPTNISDADVEVVLTVSPVGNDKHPSKDPEAWRRFVERIRGSIQDPTFIRHDQGKFEERESFE